MFNFSKKKKKPPAEPKSASEAVPPPEPKVASPGKKPAGPPQAVSGLAGQLLDAGMEAVSTPPPEPKPTKPAQKRVPVGPERSYKKPMEKAKSSAASVKKPAPEPELAQRSYKPKKADNSAPAESVSEGPVDASLQRSYKQPISRKDSAPAPPVQANNPPDKPTKLITTNEKKETKMALADTLRSILTDLRSALPETEGSLVASRDGLTIAHALPNDRDAEKLAAMVATGIGLGTRIAKTFDCGNFSETIVAGTSGSVYIYSAGEKAVLAVSAKKGANVGLINIEARDAAQRIQELT